MSNRIYNTDKVVDKIGLPNQIKYDKIDIYVDKNNKNNSWGIAYYTEYQKNKPIVKSEYIRFHDFNEMINFLKLHFNGYELTHQVDINHKQLYFHTVDYINIDYYLHEGKPKLNYIEVNYKELINNGYQIRKLRLNQEYEDMILDIIRISKQLPSINKLNSNLVNTIDVYASKKKNKERNESLNEIINNRETRRIKREMDSHLLKRNDEQKKSNKIKNLKIAMSTIALGALLFGGYKLVNTSPKIITQNNPTISKRDIELRFSAQRIEPIISNLMKENYSEVTNSDLDFIDKYTKYIEYSNYDANNSSTMINYVNYFGDQLLLNSSDINYSYAKDVLEKIEKLYSSSFHSIDNEVYVNQVNINKYLDYVASLTFMYDTTVDQRGGNHVPMQTQSVTSKYATKKEVETYNNFPLVLKYIILNQLKETLRHNDYHVTELPSNYFKGTDKDDLVNEVKKRMKNIMDELEYHCNSSNKTM